ncbi:hypothetical protein BSKO_08394 [Bryopsis sp. KO-2023]|nr:hypothetical protein BSKO_08394 [Bryopsis sp. KO-2023]
MAARLSSTLAKSRLLSSWPSLRPCKVLHTSKYPMKVQHAPCAAVGRSFRTQAAASTASTKGKAIERKEQSVNGNGASGYGRPPKEIVDIVDVPSVPLLSISPDRKLILQSFRPSPMPPISELARPELKLAGLRVDAAAFSRSRMGYYLGLALVDAKEVVPASEEKQRPIVGIPEGMWINSVSFSLKGKHIAFTIRSPGGPNDPPRGPSELWVADVDTCVARPISSTKPCKLNTIYQDYSWLDDETVVVFSVPMDHGAPPQRPIAPVGPTVQDNSNGKKAQSQTFQDLLKDAFDEDMFEYISTSEFLVLDINSGAELAKAPPRMYTGMSGSPDGRYLLVSWIERPFSFQLPCGRFPKRVELWDRNLELVREIAYLPLAEDIPVSFDSCRKGPRGIRWRPDKPSELCWREAQDGGDSKVEASPRDIVYTMGMTEAGNGGEAQILAKTDLRCGGVSFCDGDLALVYESWWNTRKSIVSVIAPDRRDEPSKILFDRNYEDVYNDPGSPVSRRTSMGTDILARIDGERKLLLSGTGASEAGNRPFLDLLDVDTGETQRIWQSKSPYYEYMASILSDKDDKTVTLEGLEVLMSRESVQTVPQYFSKTFSNEGTESTERLITQFPHPYPQMKDIRKEIIRYKRSDGISLTATLYLPVGYDKEKDGPLPCIMWAYPREFKSKDAAGQLRRSPYEFASIGALSPMVFLAKNYAILSGPTMPIVAEGEEEPNDTYVEQLTASAEAAVNAVVEKGIVDRNRIAVGGHSYGAFMAANLLAHCPDLFACGIARSGAYNRTLTPFSFQAEQRTLWDATNVYMKMSPFMMADRIKKPLLLIHGSDDNNSGTYPMQSERFYAALKGHGASCRLVLLPHESHSYRAHESIMHCLHEMDQWLETHCVTSNNGKSG